MAPPMGEDQLVSCAQIAALSRLAGTAFSVTAPQSVANVPVLRGSYVMTALRSGVVVHATDTWDLHDLTSQVVHSEGITLSLFLEGHADVSLGGRPFRFGRAAGGDAAVLVRTQPDLFIRKGRRGLHVRKVNITVPAEWLAAAEADRMDRQGQMRRITGDHLANVRWTASARLAAIAEQILLAPPYAPFLRDLYLESRAMELLFEAFSMIGDGAVESERPRPRLKQRMWHVQDYLEARLGEGLSLEQVAQEAGMSVTSLQRAFRSVFGSTVFEYVRKRRLERARDALVAEGISVTEAATIAGYTSSANFSTAFKRAFGVPPKSMR
ncbi:AraC family transcriptional regulator [Xanthobacter sp. YC-JY1]|uniref:helix-turn-helix transcriptional regulator n=1 Tax=Xanthobacter sp. YC-JY1 TaxID=2419844 RepID=UPI001F25C92F|nr:AraC family transcriptional regulator [Xanthobacter sp. YC-JY1]